MERKKLKFMDVNEEDVLDREQMRNIMAGSGGTGSNSGGNCRVAVSNPDGSFAYYSECTTVNDAQTQYNFYGSGNPYSNGTYASGYCCASCGGSGFSNADPCY